MLLNSLTNKNASLKSNYYSNIKHFRYRYWHIPYVRLTLNLLMYKNTGLL